MSVSLFNRVGGAPPPPLLGSDAAPATYLPSAALQNAVVADPRTAGGEPVRSLSVALVGPAAVDVEVYQGDETGIDGWILLGVLAVPAGGEARIGLLSGTGTTKIAAYVRPLLGAQPNGTYTFGVATDQAAVPLPAGAATEATLTDVLDVLAERLMPVSASSHAPARASSGLIKASGGVLWSIYADSSVNTDVWLLTFDSAVLPPNGTAPLDFVQIPRNDNGEGFIAVPRETASGIYWAASTTDDVLTLFAGAPLLVRARYT